MPPEQAADVLLATCAALPDGERGDLLGALAARGVRAAWSVWDDPAVDWGAARLVVVRSTWDYQHRAEEFLAWARRVESATALLNGAGVFAWNLDKSYLVRLAEQVPTIATRALGPDVRRGVAEALLEVDEVVVKPRTGASGVGVLAVASADDPRLAGVDGAASIVQPLLGSVRTAGETSVFVLGGRAVSQVDKRPAAGEIRVHEEYGGRTVVVPLDERAVVAERAIAAAAQRWAADLAYARVDLLRGDDGTWLVGELELIEPGLYLDQVPANADAFADLVAATLTRSGGP